MPYSYCSVSSIKANEFLFGTASKINRFLLLEYPDSWGEKPFAESYIDNKIKFRLNSYLENGLFSRILLIKNNYSVKGKINLFAVDNREEDPFINQTILNDYTEIHNLDMKRFFEKDKDQIPKKQLYLVCTNGKKDKCCSKFGIPIFNSLQQLDSSVWQCSHVGGDRFAPNVIHLPYSHYYGHLTITQLVDFYENTSKAQIFIQNYRGRSCYSAITQAAEYFLRVNLIDFSFDAIQFTKQISLPGKSTTEIEFYHRRLKKYFRIIVDVQKSKEMHLLTCKAQKEEFSNVFELVSLH